MPKTRILLLDNISRGVVVSPTPPSLQNVVWLDEQRNSANAITSLIPKAFVNGMWQAIGSAVETSGVSAFRAGDLIDLTHFSSSGRSNLLSAINKFLLEKYVVRETNIGNTPVLDSSKIFAIGSITAREIGNNSISVNQIGSFTSYSVLERLSLMFNYLLRSQGMYRFPLPLFQRNASLRGEVRASVFADSAIDLSLFINPNSPSTGNRVFYGLHMFNGLFATDHPSSQGLVVATDVFESLGVNTTNSEIASSSHIARLFRYRGASNVSFREHQLTDPENLLSRHFVDGFITGPFVAPKSVHATDVTIGTQKLIGGGRLSATSESPSNIGVVDNVGPRDICHGSIGVGEGIFTISFALTGKADALSSTTHYILYFLGLPNAVKEYHIVGYDQGTDSVPEYRFGHCNVGDGVSEQVVTVHQNDNLIGNHKVSSFTFTVDATSLVALTNNISLSMRELSRSNAFSSRITYTDNIGRNLNRNPNLLTE